MIILGGESNNHSLLTTNEIKMKLLVICVLLILISLSWVRTTKSSRITEQSTLQTTIPGTTLSPEEECRMHNRSCDDCVGVAKAQCVYCQSAKTCKLKKSIIPTDECALSDARWGVCWVNYEALIITVSVVAGVIILGITICCCCCCRGKGKEKLKKWEDKWEKDKAERKARNDERRAERQQKTDEIRRKYGLIKEDVPYTKFK
ncbi:hypothetical protein CHS0354_006381 [Potamilus streckersoni]|uniref:PTTG1IP n=1 Tax=Potamilus streckersoni TaxID=2493646 RepID=A0AAE0SEQ9_9BIVA|nr:hypothetical protein CHS0354_006381 [Potamilus streckersoni]